MPSACLSLMTKSKYVHFLTPRVAAYTIYKPDFGDVVNVVMTMFPHAMFPRPSPDIMTARGTGTGETQGQPELRLGPMQIFDWGGILMMDIRVAAWCTAGPGGMQIAA